MELRPKVLVAHPVITTTGGADGVAAWTLQTLKNRFDVTVATISEPDYQALNHYFDTDLQRDDFRLAIWPKRYNTALKLMPLPQGYLTYSLLQRHVHRLCRHEQFDVFISTSNELSFPKPGLQYIHYPRLRPQRPNDNYRWYHQIPGLLNLYRRCCDRVATGAVSNTWKNLSLCNSEYIADMVNAIPSSIPERVQVLTPPVPGNAEPKPWPERIPRIICVGRIDVQKRVDFMLDVMNQVHQRHKQISAVVVGQWNCDPSHRRRLESVFRENQTWLEHRQHVSRTELTKLLDESRYGIHAMPDEHFGMAVAEMQQSGCITFVPESGGPPEIIGRCSEQMFDTVDNAVKKICQVIDDTQLQDELHHRALNRAPAYSTQRFSDGLLSAVQKILNTTPD